MHPWLLKIDQPTDVCDPTTSAEPLSYMARVEGIRAKEMHQESSTTPLDSLSAIDQYIISLKRTHGCGYLRFDALESCPDIVAQIRRMAGYTQNGKVWADENGGPLAVITMDVTTDAKARFLQLERDDEVSWAVRELVTISNPEPWPPSGLTRYSLNRSLIPHVAMDADLEAICEFVAHTQLRRDSRVSLTVCGWNLRTMTEPRDLLGMLAHRFKQVSMYVEQATDRVIIIEFE